MTGRMLFRATLLGAALFSASSFAQDQQEQDPALLEEGETVERSVGELIEDTFQPRTLASTEGAMLRGLDKINANVENISLQSGNSQRYGGLIIRLGECRAPADNPSGDAFAWLEISEDDSGELLFSGWMIASAPAISAMDHPRYDVWVLNCITSAG